MKIEKEYNTIIYIFEVPLKYKIYYLTSVIYISFKIIKSEVHCAFYLHAVSLEEMGAVVNCEFDLVPLICTTHPICSVYLPSLTPVKTPTS